MRAALLAVAALAAVAVGAWIAPSTVRADDDARTNALVVRAGTVHTGGEATYSPGAVLVVDGKVAAVGPSDTVTAPPGARIVDGGPHATVVPGFVAGYSEHLSADGVDPASVAPDVRAIDGFDPFADESRFLSSGITTAFISPGTRRVVTGRGAVVHLAGGDPSARALAPVYGLVGGVGASVQRPPALLDPPSLPDATIDPLLPHRAQLPVTRAGSLLLLRRLIDDAKAGRVDLGGVLARREPLFLSAHTEADLRAALDFGREAGVDLVLVGAHGASGLIDEIRAAGARVVFEWPGSPGAVADQTPELVAARTAARVVPAKLAAAGIPFALTTADDRTLGDLHFVAAQAARHGLDPARALRAITSDAAAILGVESRVGTLQPGASGDLVLLSGAPASLMSFPRMTVVGGDVVWERTADGDTVVLRAAEVHLGDGRVLRPGEVAFHDGVIVEVGDRVGVPAGARFIDLGRGAVVPGFIDALSHAGMAGSGANAARDLATGVEPRKAIRMKDGAFGVLARSGVTTVLSAPGGNGPITGRTVVVKTGPKGVGGRRRIVRTDAGLLIRLSGERDLPAAVDRLEKAFGGAKKYLDSLAKYAKDKAAYEKWKKEFDAKKAAEAKKPEGAKAPAEGEKKKAEAAKKPEKPEEEKKPPVAPTPNPDLAAYEPYLKGQLPVLVRAETVEELRAALGLAKKIGFKMVVVGGRDVRRLEGALDKAKVGVIAGPRVVDGRERVNVLRELALSGMPAAVGSDAHAGGAELGDLLAYAVARGLSPAAAIRMVTGDAAKLLGVERRVGTLAPGRDADLVLLTGPPFALGSSVRAVYVGGEEVDDE